MNCRMLLVVELQADKPNKQIFSEKFRRYLVDILTLKLII